MTTLFVVEMLRWGRENSHHYLLGAYSSRQAAELAADVEISWRACKYQSRITELTVDAPLSAEQLEHHRMCRTDDVTE